MQSTEQRAATVRAGCRAWLATTALPILAALGLIATPAAGAPAERTARRVFRIADLLGGGPPTPARSSTLARTDRGMSATLETAALTPGHV